jgi:hypothetical protein
MGLDLSTWSEALLAGGVASVAFAALFLAARWRWKDREAPDAQADVGLD